MLLDMIHDNHGEPPFKTRYRDPAVLRAMGYEGVVIPDALAIAPGAEAAVDAQVKAAAAAGMQVFFYGDALLLPKAMAEPNAAAYCCDDGSGRLCPGKPAVYEAMQKLVRELFARWPAAGLVMRTGEVYPEATPHMMGSPLHAGACATCRGISAVERQIRFIHAMHDVVIGELGKSYVHRAWQPHVPGVPSMHDDPLTYRQVAAAVPDSPKLTFSFKFTRGDFRRGQSFNPCLMLDERPKWIEFQCEREYEGKGALPNYQAPLWRAFFEQLMRQHGLSADEVRGRFGIWGWSRGGGWGGPYAQREEWIDANVRALAGLHRRPDAEPDELASEWVGATFNVAESSPGTPAVVELLKISSPTIRRLLYVAALTAKGENGPPWLRDDQLDVEAIRATAVRVVETGVATEALLEKRDAMEGVDRMRQLLDIAAPELPFKSQVRDLANCLAYFQSFAGTVTHLFAGFVRFTAWIRGGRADEHIAGAAREHLEAARSHWQSHIQRHAMLPGAPSMFHEMRLWELTNTCLAELEDAADAV